MLDLRQYKLPIFRRIEPDMMLKMYESNLITAPYVISHFVEEHFKPMIDEYAKKVLICGRVPPL